MPRLRRPRRTLPRMLPRAAALTAALLAVPALTVLATASPSAATITSLTNGATYAGNVTITESGASNPCVTGGSPYSRISVTRVSDSTVVFTNQQSGTGAKSATWNSVGQPRGSYRVQTWTRSTSKSGLLNLGCTDNAEVAQSDIVITIDNHAGVTLTAPASVITGEHLTVTAKTSVGNRQVTLTVPGTEIAPQTITTDGQGAGTATFDLPDLPAGSLSLKAAVSTDALYTGDGGTASTTLTKRSTHTFYRGDTRGEPGTTAHLSARLVDVTPDSDRYGQVIADKQVVLALGDDTLTATTNAAGDAARTARVTGSSRVAGASATFTGDGVFAASSDTIKFYVGDVAAEPAPVVAGPVQGNASGLLGLVGGLLNPVLGAVKAVVSPVENAVGVPAISSLLDALAPTIQNAGSYAGAGVDRLLGAVDKKVIATTPLKGLSQTAQFQWRAVVVGPDGVQHSSEYGAVIGVPQMIDVTGDNKADLIATIKLTQITSGTLVPEIQVVRIGDTSAALPLSLQAVIDLPVTGSTDTYRFGYDTRNSSAPQTFTADIVLGTGGATLDVASSGQDPLAVSGAIVPASSGSTPAPKEQRFAVSFDSAPTNVSLGLTLGGSSQFAAALNTDRPTKIGISLTDDSGAAQVFTADGTIDSVDGTLSLAVTGDQASGLGADITSAHGLAQVALHAQEIDNGRTATDIELGLTDVPTSVRFGLDAAGAGQLSASGPIGVFEAGYAQGRDIATLDDPAYLRLAQDADTSSVALRLPGFECLSLDLADDMSIGLTMAPTPLHALVQQDGLTLDAEVTDAPHHLDLALGADGHVRIAGSAPIASVDVTAHNDAGIFDGSTDLALALSDVPSLLEVGVTADGVRFGTGDDPIGSLEVYADDGTHLALPADQDGLVMRTSPGSTALAGRISGLRTIDAALGAQPSVLLDTVAGKVFGINLIQADAQGNETSHVSATVDHLVPDVRLGLVDDGSGSTRLSYSADEPTNALTFDIGSMKGSISNPLPASLQVCQAADASCLPEVGIANPTLGSVSLHASQTTTLNIVDSTGAMNVNNLRLRVLDLTGSVDTTNGGPLYLNTTEYGAGCETGCPRPIEGGSITSDLGSAILTFTPGNGFNANRALTNLKVNTLLGVPIGLSGASGTGSVTCVGDTAINVNVLSILNVSVKDAICNVARTS